MDNNYNRRNNRQRDEDRDYEQDFENQGRVGNDRNYNRDRNYSNDSSFKRGYGSRYRDEHYINQEYPMAGRRGAPESEHHSNPKSQQNESAEFSDHNYRQSPHWERDTDPNYSDWRNGRPSRGLGRNVGDDTGQSHRGKGPKNYKRSDERIMEDVSDTLTDHHEIDASDIDIEVSDGNVIMKGNVDSRRTRRAAEDAIENFSGIRNVENRLHTQTYEASDSDDKENIDAKTD